MDIVRHATAPIPIPTEGNPYLVRRKYFKVKEWAIFQDWMLWLLPLETRSERRAAAVLEEETAVVRRSPQPSIRPSLPSREDQAYASACIRFEMRMQTLPGSVNMLFNLSWYLESLHRGAATKVVGHRNTDKNKAVLTQLLAEVTKTRDVVVRSLMISRDAQVLAELAIQLLVISFELEGVKDVWERFALERTLKKFHMVVEELQACVAWSHMQISFLNRGIRILTRLIRTEPFVDLRALRKGGSSS